MAERAGTAVIIQPCFLPWRGQFDLMSRAETVVFLDTVQFVRHSWYNRNRIMTAHGPTWITVPVRGTGTLATLIKDVSIADERPWRRKLLATIEQAYGGHRHFAAFGPGLRELIMRDWDRLADLAQASVRWAFACVGRAPRFVTASSLDVAAHDPIDRLVQICRKLGAHRYLSGPAARDYIASDAPFAAAGIQLEWMTYDYPAYPQLRPSELPMSIIDLLFNVGADAPHYIWGGPTGEHRDD